MVKETARARGNWEGLCMALRDGRGHAADYSAADRRRAEGIHAFQPPPNSLPACLPACFTTAYFKLCSHAQRGQRGVGCGAQSKDADSLNDTGARQMVGGRRLRGKAGQRRRRTSAHCQLHCKPPHAQPARPAIRQFQRLQQACTLPAGVPAAAWLPGGGPARGGTAPLLSPSHLR